MRPQIRVGDVLHAFHEKWKMVILAFIAGILIGLFLVGIQLVRGSNPDYEITGSFAIVSRSSTGKFTGNYESANDYYLAEDMVDSVKYVLSSREFLDKVLKNLNLKGYTKSMISDNLELTQYNETQIVDVTLRCGNEKDGLKILNYIFKEAANELPRTLQIGSVSIINSPASSFVGNGKTYLSVILFASALGLCAGIGMILIELIVNPTLINENDMESEFGIESIGQIPEIDKKKIMAGPDDKETDEAFSSAAYILRNLLGKKNTCFYITSTQREEGRSYVAANLALHLSKMEKRVLLIDMDIVSPGVLNLFSEKVDYSRTLNSLYREEALITEVIYPINGYLDVIPSVREHTQIALSNEMKAILLSLDKKYDYTIIDAAPVGESSDVLGLKQLTDTVLFVAKHDSTTIPNIKDAIEKLDKSGTRILGCIINFATKKKRTEKKTKEQQSEHQIDEMVKQESFYQEEDIYQEYKNNDSEMINELIRLGLSEEEVETDEE